MRFELIEWLLQKRSCPVRPSVGLRSAPIPSPGGANLSDHRRDTRSPSDPQVRARRLRFWQYAAAGLLMAGFMALPVGRAHGDTPPVEDRVAALEAKVTALQQSTTTQGQQLAVLADLNVRLSKTVVLLSGQLGTLQTALQKETDRALAAEAALQTALTTETNRAQAAEALLTTHLADEGTQRQQNDQSTLASAESYADAGDQRILAASGTGQPFPFSSDQVAALRSLTGLAPFLQLNTLDSGLRNGYPEVTVVGANLRVVDGLGATGTANGVGNVIVGYNERRDGGDVRVGSHNLLLGARQNYASYGGLAAGRENSLSGPFVAITGGEQNTASGFAAVVNGGAQNTASGHDAVVSAGYHNLASGNWAVVSGTLNATSRLDYMWRVGSHSGVTTWIPGDWFRIRNTPYDYEP